MFTRFFLFLSILYSTIYSIEPHFKVVILGSGGGPLESNVSGYLFAPLESQDFINVDAGTLLHGVEEAASNHCFDDIKLNPESPYTLTGQIFRDHIKAHLISHPHLDHVGGLVINSPLSTPKKIYGTPFTIEGIAKNLFNNVVWPNLGNEGEAPLNIFTYVRMPLGEKMQLPANMTVQAFPLSHPDGYESTAFLLESNDHYILYFGDTSTDALEKDKHIETVWKKIAPLIEQNKLHGIFIECSYTDAHADKRLYGHLKPSFLLQELQNLSKLVKLNGLKVSVVHIKELFQKGMTSHEIIQKELLEGKGNLDVEFLFPLRGTKLTF